MNKKIKWFTLVELIIVIVILSILATISFISFSWYLNKTRDSKKISEINLIKKAVEIYSIQTWNYPKLTKNNSTVLAKWKEIIYSWEIDDELSKLLKLNSLKKDAKYETQYIYWVNYEFNKFEIWSYLEKQQNLSFINKTYADLQDFVSIVDWNYDWIIKFSTWWKLYLTNPPSLLLNNTWSVNLYWEENLYFLVNWWKNIYHNIKNVDWVSKILNENYWSWATLTWFLIDWVNESNISSTFTKDNWLLTSFWWNLDKIANNILGNNSSISYNDCNYNWFNFWHNKKQVFYSQKQAYSCLDKSIIYSCINWEIFDDSNLKITWISSFQFDTCEDNTSCKFDWENLFNWTCHF